MIQTTLVDSEPCHDEELWTNERQEVQDEAESERGSEVEENIEVGMVAVWRGVTRAEEDVQRDSDRL